MFDWLFFDRWKLIKSTTTNLQTGEVMFESGPALIIFAVIDSSPDDTVLDNNRWHTIAIVQGDPLKFNKLQERFNSKNFKVQKWRAKGNRQNHKYRKEIVSEVIALAKEGDPIFIEAYSFCEKEMVSLIPQIIKNFKIDSYINESNNKLIIQFPNKKVIEWKKNDFYFLISFLEAVATYFYNAQQALQKENSLSLICANLLIDKFSGDYELKGQFVKEVLDLAFGGRVNLTMSIQSDFSLADLLADNFAGWLNGCMTKPDSRYRDAFELISENKQQIFNWYQLQYQEGNLRWVHVLKNTHTPQKELNKLRNLFKSRKSQKSI